MSSATVIRLPGNTQAPRLLDATARFYRRDTFEPTTVAAYRKTLEALAAAVGDVSVDTVTTDQIEQLLHDRWGTARPMPVPDIEPTSGRAGCPTVGAVVGMIGTPERQRRMQTDAITPRGGFIDWGTTAKEAAESDPVEIRYRHIGDGRTGIPPNTTRHSPKPLEDSWRIG